MAEHSFSGGKERGARNHAACGIVTLRCGILTIVLLVGLPFIVIVLLVELPLVVIVLLVRLSARLRSIVGSHYLLPC